MHAKLTLSLLPHPSLYDQVAINLKESSKVFLGFTHSCLQILFFLLLSLTKSKDLRRAKNKAFLTFNV